MPDEIHIHIDGPDDEAARYAFRILLADAEAALVFHRVAPSALPPEAVLITYTRHPGRPTHGRQLVLCASGRLWDAYGREASLPPSPLPRLPLAALGVQANPRLQDPLVLPYVSETGPPTAQVQRGPMPGDGLSILTGADLVASTFFWITRYEESLIRERDAEGRIPQALLRGVQEALTERPLVDEYVELLKCWLEMLGSRVSFRRPAFRVLLTHDVDTGIGVRGFRENAENGLRTLYRDTVRGGRPGTGLLGLGSWMLRALGVQAETELFRDIAKLDAEFGFPSFFFLMANGTHPKDATYDILGDASREVIEAIRESGGGVGLHVGLDAHKTLAQFRSEWERLRQAEPKARPVSRSHFLAFFPPSTWRQLLELGLQVDSTLGFSHHIGFRCGTSRGFRPFDVERRVVVPIWELPMTVMDVNLFYEAAQNGERIAAVRDLVGRVKAHGGCFVINWHNVSFLGHYRTIYRAILGDLRGAQPIRFEDLPAGKESLLW